MRARFTCTGMARAKPAWTERARLALPRCGQRIPGQVIADAAIEEPEVIAKILSHLEKTAPDRYQAELPLGARASLSQASLL